MKEQGIWEPRSTEALNVYFLVVFSVPGWLGHLK